LEFVKNIGKIIIVVLCLVKGYSQDIHFSQFYHSPMNLNPGLAGQFDGDYRFVGNYRNQWSSVTVPYKTFSFSADATKFLKRKDLGAGIVFNHDNTGDSRFKTTVFNVVGSYKIALNKDSNQYLAGGLQTGITNKRLSYEPLQFDAQYNGARYDAGLPNNENFTTSGQTYLNLHAGVSYFYQIENRKRIEAGIALFNLTSPKETFFGNGNVRLDRRVTAHATVQYQVADKIDVMPSVFLMKQGTYTEFIFGSLGKYIVNDFRGDYQAAYVGMWYRTKDAGYMSAGYEFNSWNVSLSYDFNLSTLKPASSGRGGIELAVIYILKQFKPVKIKHRVCPNYL
jgi:type IX secretion system PorP/SprF family membrane protein